MKKMNKKNTELIHKISVFLKSNYMRSDFSHKKIKQKNKRTCITQKKPLKDIYSKYFEIFQKLNNLLVIYFFITKFIITFAHPFKKAC